MASILNPTHTLFKSRKIKFDYDAATDNRKVIATEDIFVGDLLLVEHGIADIIDCKDSNNVNTTNNKTALNILYNPDFYKELYPRTYDHNIDNIINSVNDDNINYTEAITEKISKNVFKHPITADKSLYVLFRDITKFNHSATAPNANHSYLEIKIDGIDAPIIIYYLICCQDILKNDEVCINYGNDYFKENTDLTHYNDKHKPYFKKNDSKLKKLVYNYLNSNQFNDVIYNHHFYNSGLIYSNSKYIGLPSFYSLYNKEKTRDETADITIKEMNEWINSQIAFITHLIQKYLKALKI